MLSRKEKCVMTYLYDTCNGKGAVLISPHEIIEGIMHKYELNNIEIDQILSALAMDEYIELVNSDSKGKLVYCISR